MTFPHRKARRVAARAARRREQRKAATKMAVPVDIRRLAAEVREAARRDRD